MLQVEKEVELEHTKIEGKVGVIDLKATINKGEIVDIEMQVRQSKSIKERSLFYWSALYHNQLLKGAKFEDLKKVITINILIDGEIAKDGPPVEKVQLKSNYKNRVLINDLDIYFIQIPKFLKNPKSIKNKNLRDWLYFFIQNKKEVNRAMKENTKIKEAQDEYEYLTGDAAKRRLEFLELKYDLDRNTELWESREEGKEEGLKKGRKEGLEKGREEGLKTGLEKGKKEISREIAQKLLEKGMTVEEVQEITNLTKEEIHAMIKK